MAERDWMAPASDGWQRAQRYLAIGLRYYKWGFWLTVAVAVTAVIVAVLANSAGVKMVSYILAAVFMAVWAFYQFRPTWLFWIFLAGVPAGFPESDLRRLFVADFAGAFPNIRLRNMFGEGGLLVRKYLRMTTYVLLTAALALMVIGTWDIEAPKYALPVFLALILLGVWTALFVTDATWYKNITLVLIFAFLAIGFWGLYTHVWQQDVLEEKIAEETNRQKDRKNTKKGKEILQALRDGKELTPDQKKALRNLRTEKADRGFQGALQDWVSFVHYSEQIPVIITSLQPTEFCHPSLPKNARLQFEPALPKGHYDVIIHGVGSRGLDGDLRINGAQAAQSFVTYESGGQGCVEVSVEGDPAFLRNKIDRQIFQINFVNDKLNLVLMLAVLGVLAFGALKGARWIGSNGHAGAHH